MQSERIVRDRSEISIGSCRYPGELVTSKSQEGETFAIDGSSFDVLITKRLQNDAGLVSLQGLMQAPGAFSLLATYSGGLIAGRDLLGQKPLYYGVNSTGAIAVASLRYPLEDNGFENTREVLPGRLFTVTNVGLSPVFDASLSEPNEENIPEQSGTTRLAELFREAVAETFPKGSAIAFSGGLDSSLIAYQAKNLGLEPSLVTVGLEGQQELAHARRVAEKIGLKILVRELSEPEVMDSISKVVRIIESEDPVLIGISIPLYFACEVASKTGAKTIVMGQLSDELFGGYGRFEDMAIKNKFEDARSEIWRSVLAASAKDFDPGDKMAVSFKLQLRCPFAYLPLVQYALKVPTGLKLRVSGQTVARKFILRRVADRMGLPEEIVNRPKKAVQYSSGVQRILLREANRRGLTIVSLIQSIVNESTN